VPKRASKSAILARVRRICLALPETTERASHGAPTFFVRDRKSFVTFMDDHHGDGRLALWCACPRGMREGLVKANLEAYFVPPYVGYLGWIGVRLDRGLTWDEIERVIREAYVAVAPKTLVTTNRSAQ